MYFDQREYDIRFEWGLSGLETLAPVSDVMIIVDVLSFTTCVEIVVARGGGVYPYRGEAEALRAYAAAVDAFYSGYSWLPKCGIELIGYGESMRVGQRADR